MRAIVTLLSIVFLSAITMGDSPAKPESDLSVKPTSFWMQRKMTYSQEILRGLASADFEAVGVNARQMRTLSKVEGFVRSRHASYRNQLQVFESVCDEMIRNADEKNLPGVTLAFNQMTVSCVNCHQTMRSQASEPVASPTQSNPESNAATK